MHELLSIFDVILYIENIFYIVLNLKGKKIGISFTILAGLIILVHAVVPHNHQYDFANSFELESTWKNFGQNKNTENHHFHCHVFNDLVSEKTINFFVNQPFPDFQKFISSGINFNIASPLLKNVTSIFFGYRFIYINDFFVTAQSLRAPPSNI